MSNLSAAAIRLNLDPIEIRDIVEIDVLDNFTVTEIVEMIHVPWEDPAD